MIKSMHHTGSILSFVYANFYMVKNHFHIPNHSKIGKRKARADFVHMQCEHDLPLEGFGIRQTVIVCQCRSPNLQLQIAFFSSTRQDIRTTK